MQAPVASFVDQAGQEAEGKDLAGMGVAGELQVDAKIPVQSAGRVQSSSRW